MSQKKIVKKESKIKKLLKVAKDIWNTKQYRAAIRLFLYLFFVVGVLIFLQLSSSRNPEKVYLSPLDKFKQANNYEYIYTLTEDTISQTILGIRYQEEENFQITGHQTRYLLQNNQLYALLDTGSQLVDKVTSYRMIDVRPNKLAIMIEKGKEISTTNYTTGEEETTYQLSVSEFANIYDGLPIDSEEFITIKVMIKENNIISVTLDLINYRKKYVPTSTQYILKLDYRNYGMVEKL